MGALCLALGNAASDKALVQSDCIEGIARKPGVS